MTDWCTGRPEFWLILFAAPAAAWLLPGRESLPVFPLAASAAAYAIPGAALLVWVRSKTRKSLASFLIASRAGRTGLLVPELAFTAAAGSLVSAVLCWVWQLTGNQMPWQVWAMIPFCALSASSLASLSENRFPLTGRTLLLAGFLLQASDAPWASSPVFQLGVPQGYILRSAEWAAGGDAALHGDVFLFFSVIESIGLLLLAVKLSRAVPAPLCRRDREPLSQA